MVDVSHFRSEPVSAKMSREAAKLASRRTQKHASAYSSCLVQSKKDLLSETEQIRALTTAHMDHAFNFFQNEHEVEPSKVPGLSRWQHLSLSAAVCAVLMIVNTNDTILKSLSQQHTGERYLPSSVMLLSNLISVFVGNTLCMLLAQRAEDSCMGDPGTSWRGALQQFWASRQLLQMSLPAVFFTLSGTLKFLAFGLVQPEVVVIMEQGSVLLSAVVGWAWFKKSYSRKQWVMLSTVTGGLLWHHTAERRAILEQGLVHEQGAAEPLGRYFTGLVLMAGSVLMVTMGGLSCERLLKGSTGRPFYVQKAQMELSMAGSGLIYCLVVQPLLQGSCPLLQRGLLHGWDFWTVLVLISHTAKSWLATTTVLLLDNLTYSLVGSASLLLVYGERLVVLSEEPWADFAPEVLVALLTTALGVAGFMVVTSRKLFQKKPKRKPSWNPSLAQPLLLQKNLEGSIPEEVRRSLLEKIRPAGDQDPCAAPTHGAESVEAKNR